VTRGRRVGAVVKRHAWVMWRSPHRWFDVAFWPLVDVLLWGSLGVFVSEQASGTRAGVPYLLAGILLFHVLYQSQIAVSTGFMEETWSRNLLNLMTTPLTEGEYAAGVALFGLAKLAMGMAVVTACCVGFYSFNVVDVGWGLLPVAAILLVAGWVISLFVIGLILRFGQGAEILAWGITFVIMPLSGVFYPVDALPGPIQPVAEVLPTTAAFTATRAMVGGAPIPWGTLARGGLGALVAAAAGVVFLTRMLAVFRDRGYVTRFS
jgi:ABC-2 type transport system permease protein